MISIIHKRAIILDNNEVITIGDIVEYEVNGGSRRGGRLKQWLTGIITKINDDGVEFDHDRIRKFNEIYNIKKANSI